MKYPLNTRSVPPHNNKHRSYPDPFPTFTDACCYTISTPPANYLPPLFLSLSRSNSALKSSFSLIPSSNLFLAPVRSNSLASLSALSLRSNSLSRCVHRDWLGSTGPDASRSGIGRGTRLDVRLGDARWLEYCSTAEEEWWRARLGGGADEEEELLRVWPPRGVSSLLLEERCVAFERACISLF